MMPRLLFVVLLLSVCSSDGAIYKWVDENGKVHFTDKPPDDTRAEEVELRINTYTSVEIKPLVERLGKKGKVVIYGATWCHTCDKARRYFRTNNIPYVYYDVERSRVGKMDFNLLRGKSVPIIIVGNRRMNGFTVPRFESLYQQYLKSENSKTQADDGSG
jgi:glutaredoxin